MYRLTIAALGVVALALMSLGCGSSGGGSDSSATNASADAGMTKAQFIEQAEAICAKNAKERKAAIADWEKEGDGSASLQEGLVEIVAPALTEEAEALKALEPPKGQQAKVAKMIENLSKGSAAVEESSPGPEIAQFSHEAAIYGLKTCAAL
jgi:hypothetical protein